MILFVVIDLILQDAEVCQAVVAVRPSLHQLVQGHHLVQLLGNFDGRGPLHFGCFAHGLADGIYRLRVALKVVLHALGIQMRRLQRTQEGVTHAQAIAHHAINIFDIENARFDQTPRFV